MADEINQAGYPQKMSGLSGMIQPPTDTEKQPSQDMNPASPNDTFSPLLEQSSFPAQRTPDGKLVFDYDNKSTIATKPTGSSGTQLFGGYFTEEYLQSLRGRLGAIKWDEMIRSEPQVMMLMGAIFNPIKSANWEIESAKPGDAEADKHADLVRHILFDRLNFSTFKHEALTHVLKGFACFEKIHEPVFDDPQFGTFMSVKALAFRSQRTIYRWNLEKRTGKLLGVEQYVFSDIGDNVYIPGQFLMVITHNKEGDNLEGIGILRAMYGPWDRKNMYQKLAAIGIEKYAVGTVKGTVPAGKENGEDTEKFKALLAAFSSHQTAFLMVPEGWPVEILRGEFKATEIKEMIALENTEMINVIQANFLALGMHGSSGAYALSGDLSDFYLKGLYCIAEHVGTALNNDVIKDIVKLNFGPQKAYPKCVVSGINDKAGKELAEALKLLVQDAKAIKPDKPLEDHLRKLYKLPRADATTQAAYVVANVTEKAQTTAQEAAVQFSEGEDDTNDTNDEKAWAAQDGCCDACDALDGTPVSELGGKKPPLHDNCECEIE